MSEQLVAKSDEIRDGKLFSTKYEGADVLISRVDGQLTAFSAKCPHMGMPLNKGKVSHGDITCPWHGAEFNMINGHCVKWANKAGPIPLPKWTHKFIAMGKKPCNLKMFKVTEREGLVYLSR